MAKKQDQFFYNSRTNTWFFFGTPEDELTGLQAAYILSMSDEDIAEQIKDDVLVLPGRPFMHSDTKRFFKKAFTVSGTVFFVDINDGNVVRVRGNDLGKFIYTD